MKKPSRPGRRKRALMARNSREQQNPRLREERLLYESLAKEIQIEIDLEILEEINKLISLERIYS